MLAGLRRDRTLLESLDLSKGNVSREGSNRLFAAEGGANAETRE
jgi:hypothetical protein